MTAIKPQIKNEKLNNMLSEYFGRQVESYEHDDFDFNGRRGLTIGIEEALRQTEYLLDHLKNLQQAVIEGNAQEILDLYKDITDGDYDLNRHLSAITPEIAEGKYTWEMLPILQNIVKGVSFEGDCE